MNQFKWEAGLNIILSFDIHDTITEFQSLLSNTNIAVYLSIALVLFFHHFANSMVFVL